MSDKPKTHHSGVRDALLFQPLSHGGEWLPNERRTFPPLALWTLPPAILQPPQQDDALSGGCERMAHELVAGVRHCRRPGRRQ